MTKQLDAVDFDFDKICFETSGIGFFPDKKFPNVIFLDLLDNERNSYKLAEKIDNAVQKLGFERDKKFVPHITLGRFRKGKKKRMANLPEINFENFKIELHSFYLMKSIMDSKGASYSVIKEFRFRKP